MGRGAAGHDRWGPVIDVRELFAVERAALLELLAALDADRWAAPTACPGWSVHDIAAHVLGDDLARLARTRDGHAGVAPFAGETMPDFIDRINDEWVVAARRISPRTVVELLGVTGRQIDALWRSVDPRSLGEPVTWAGPEPAPVWLDAARDYTEYWVHQQQIRDAVAADALDAPRLVGPVIDTFMRALPWTLRNAPAGPGASLAFEVAGPAGGTWSVLRSERGWRLEVAAQAPTARVVLDQDTTWRLCTRGVTPEQADARAVVEGDRALGRAALDIVAIIHRDGHTT